MLSRRTFLGWIGAIASVGPRALAVTQEALTPRGWYFNGMQTVIIHNSREMEAAFGSISRRIPFPDWYLQYDTLENNLDAAIVKLVQNKRRDEDNSADDYAAKNTFICYKNSLCKDDEEE